jgi:hypothetical protein
VYPWRPPGCAHALEDSHHSTPARSCACKVR